MDLTRRYSDLAYPCNIMQMVKEEPEWAANRIQEGERAFKELAALKAEPQNTSTSSAMDEICSNFICDYCSKNQYTCEQKFQPLIRSGACFVGRKLSPIA